jgi:protease I
LRRTISTPSSSRAGKPRTTFGVTSHYSTLFEVFLENGDIVAFICHAGWVPISAGIVEGKKVTSVSAIKDDLVNAGADWVDEKVVQDGNLMSSRIPVDLPAFCRTIITNLKDG